MYLAVKIWSLLFVVCFAGFIVSKYPPNWRCHVMNWIYIHLLLICGIPSDWILHHSATKWLWDCVFFSGVFSLKITWTTGTYVNELSISPVWQRTWGSQTLSEIWNFPITMATISSQFLFLVCKVCYCWIYLYLTIFWSVISTENLFAMNKTDSKDIDTGSFIKKRFAKA